MGSVRTSRGEDFERHVRHGLHPLPSSWVHDLSFGSALTRQRRPVLRDPRLENDIQACRVLPPESDRREGRIYG